jgi:hypothetical protein
MARMAPTEDNEGVLNEVGTEIKKNPPAILGKTAAKYGPGRASKQRVAILLSKARKAGASIPKPSMSGAKT